MKWLIFSVLLYLAGAVITDGLYAANNEERCVSRFDDGEKRTRCMWGGNAAMTAVFWPLYWPARLAYEIARD